MARALRFQASIPLKFWGECVTIVVYFLNSLPSKLLLYKSSFEMLHLHPSLSHIKTFGCLWYASCPKVLDKFSPRAISVVFMGYSSSQKGCILYDLHSKSFFVNRYVFFKEDLYPFKDLQTSSDPTFPVVALIDPKMPNSLLVSTSNSHTCPIPDYKPSTLLEVPSSRPVPASFSTSLPSTHSVPHRRSSRASKSPLWL